MKFFISTDVERFREIEDDPTRIYLCGSDQKLSAALSEAATVDVWIADGKESTQKLMQQWLISAAHHSKSMLVKDASTIPQLQTHAGGRDVVIEAFPKHVEGSVTPYAEVVLRAAEMLYIRRKIKPTPQQGPTFTHSPQETTVLLVGAGIVNLCTAEYLLARGLRVHVVDKGPDPRCCSDWTRLGATAGGGNARMFTFMEADNARMSTCMRADKDNGKEGGIYDGMRSIFRKTVRAGGWSMKQAEKFSDAELNWVNTFDELPPWLARSFRDDTYDVNRESGKLWAECIEQHPQLFEGTALRQDIVRLYAEHGALEAARTLNSAHDTILANTSPAQFLDEYPEFAALAAADHLAGGFTVKGFTLNIHPFCANLMDRIGNLGGRLTWDCDVQRIVRDDSGKVTALESQLGVLKADHYVLSLGATGNTLLEGTASENLIQGVLGVWLQLPNIGGQVQHSMKIQRRGHVVKDINVTVARNLDSDTDVLILGGGYGYVGLGSVSNDNAELASLFAAMEEVAQIYFPEAYAIAKANGTLWPGGQRKFCVRPFTATGLGVFEQIAASAGGRLVITGGNNTGGFAQAPVQARAVWRAIVGEEDPIHVLFHPARGMLSRPPIPHFETLPAPVKARLEMRPPTKVLLLCSDGPQHDYLRARLSQTFHDLRSIVETYDGQVRHLMAKNRRTDARYMRYHRFRRSLFGYDTERRRYFDSLMPEGTPLGAPDLVVDNLNCRQVWDAVEQWQPELTIVSGTKSIGRKLNERAGLVIDLHLGCLPDYKGKHSIFFAVYDQELDKIAATLHQLTPQLDGGNILEVVRPAVRPTDSEDMLYTRCLHLAIERVIELAQRYFREGKLDFVPQKAEDQTFRHCDRTVSKELWLWWLQLVWQLCTRIIESLVF